MSRALACTGGRTNLKERERRGRGGLLVINKLRRQGGTKERNEVSERLTEKWAKSV
jgi:hypothetical protein